MGKIVGYALGLISLAGVIFGWYELQISNAKKEALISFNQKQLEQVVKDQKTLSDEMQNLQIKEKTIEDENTKLNNTIKDVSSAAELAIKNSTDKQFDPIFNQILKSLKGK